MGLKPDIVTLAKPLAGGLPLSATLIPEKINSLIHIGEHGTTFGGGPVTTAVASRVWDILSDKVFTKEVREKGNYFNKILLELSASYDFLGAVKGKGLLVGVEFNGTGNGASLEDDIQRIIASARDSGLLILRSGTNVLRFAPPLIISKEELAVGVDILKSVFKNIF